MVKAFSRITAFGVNVVIFWAERVSITFSSLLGGRELLGVFGSESPQSQLPSLAALRAPFSIPISFMFPCIPKQTS